MPSSGTRGLRLRHDSYGNLDGDELRNDAATLVAVAAADEGAGANNSDFCDRHGSLAALVDMASFLPSSPRRRLRPSQWNIVRASSAIGAVLALGACADDTVSVDDDGRDTSTTTETVDTNDEDDWNGDYGDYGDCA
ncbi:hypothetical protein ENSA5_11670 [Enhygromyxa salina]|uniref:Uncharacterized protein n=1 Tax=Enhygromyxa salina TaxID=215803 RepID=A0A2S9YFU1_9BACT|nr:hypothetical protein [Enhygromyxa salina]PRQ03984.1 hypothetical protein ENSA5_11670 [Enhygromyxa salina]